MNRLVLNTGRWKERGQHDRVVRAEKGKRRRNRRNGCRRRQGWWQWRWMVMADGGRSGGAEDSGGDNGQWTNGGYWRRTVAELGECMRGGGG
ncbi:unnamed protein product [Spirodela intermedia]|uniref:Uncharacterized protein n=1 Tax=Spirodela intermedia TaxID=51605 RepID=A0A7I8JF14_SPIIN|nr:unnamed protein product [Spirodela intermedia]CAA6668727.1 unnamed protein product [Spirodela intermedia]